MTNKELQDILSMVEGIIVDGKGDVCNRVASVIDNLKKTYQRELELTIEQIKAVLANHNIDCRVSGKDIADYVENNVPVAEVLNE